MRTVFHNKDGSLSRYGLACGYVSKFESEETRPYTVYTDPPFESTIPARKAELYMEHAHFQVRFIDHDTGEREWLSFDSLTEARKQYAQFKKKVLA